MSYVCDSCPPQSGMPDWGPGPPGAKSMCLDYAWVDPLRALVCQPSCSLGSYLIGLGATGYSSTDHVEERTKDGAKYLALKASSQGLFRQALADYRVVGAIPFVTDGVGIPGTTAAAVSRVIAAGEPLVDLITRETQAGRFVLAGDDLLDLKELAAIVSVPADRLVQLVSLPDAAGELVVVAEPPIGKSALAVVTILGLGIGAVTIVGALAGWFSPTTTRSA